jgi:hypothetical protein
MATYLDEIVAAHRAAAGRDERDLNDLVARAADLPPTRGSPPPCGAASACR